VAQSIGGGGGNGGTGGGLVGIGGKGSSGGNSGVVTVSTEKGSSISTSGSGSHGILVQSIGGGGGNGGTGAGVLGIGGSSQKGGDGNDVVVSNSGNISTSGSFANAVIAQSIGGGGGNGGTGAGLVAIGGSGVNAKGGNAGNVTISGSGSFTTDGDDSNGIVAQSIGGGGGNGGGAASASVLAGAAIGGAGGDGGSGNLVSIDLDEHDVTVAGQTVAVKSLISTVGDRSKGILAQSVGGGGGNGGFAAQGTVGTFGSISVALGGDGGGGGIGGLVDIDTKATVLTDGLDSDGIVAQSIGGGGGNGGFAVSASAQANLIAGGSISVGVGGSGGEGGNAGIVKVEHEGSIITKGDQSEALVAQAIGGGGGNGGFAVAASMDLSGVAGAAVSVGVGGKGEKGGDGGTVEVDFTGTMVTGAKDEMGNVISGDDSDGIVAQSIGGGGGNGGFSVAAAFSGSAGSGAAVTASVGGSGSGGGKGGEVDVIVDGEITTYGDRADGIVAQSIGGGGGNGGFSVSVPVNISGGYGGAIGVGIGGSGAGGGNGGKVAGTVTGSIRTEGSDADGAVFQSVGGGGGNGGFNVSGNFSFGAAGSAGIAVGIGGSGGGAGNGGEVDLRSFTADVTTLGDGSDGIVAQSIGGGGGNGGFNVSGSIAASGSTGIGGAVGIGGAGGGGGDGGKVSASIDNTVATFGAGANGVVLQSVGGGGGNGGFNVSGAIGGAAGVGAAVTVGLGGSGGQGGDGGDVTAVVNGYKYTEGDGSSAIVAQSLGGGGGNGGFNVSGGIGAGGIGGGSVSVGLGGSGGLGGDGGKVSATVNASVEEPSIITKGRDADAIVAQSLGGGGGNGGFNVSGSIGGAGLGALGVSVGIGGSGGGGGDGGDVVSTTTASIATLGDGSAGLMAQSLGGGGGNGGMNVAGAISGAGKGSAAFSVGIGGSAGDGGQGGKVKGRFDGRVYTEGDGSEGLVYQSLGGGGGNGGFNVSGAITGSGIGSGAMAVGIGGSGGGGGSADSVVTSIAADVTTLGDGSTGILAQSIGGGGGNGGFSVAGVGAGAGTGVGAMTVGIGGSGGMGGDGGAVDGRFDGTVVTSGGDASGLVYQSLGGGGGNGSFSIDGNVSGAGVGSGGVSVGIGGSAGDGGQGGNITSDDTATIITYGDGSKGLLAQTIGGGGGNGGFAVSGSITGSGTGSGALSVGIGNSGGGGGDGGDVSSVFDGWVSTEGDDADGLVYQSLGGGGGNGGFAVGGVGVGAGTGSGAVAFGIGGKGGGGGNGGAVSSKATAGIETLGDGSTGLVAQSIGGGGGNGGFSVEGSVAGAGTGSGAVAVSIGGSGGSGGDGGAVDGEFSGSVYTKGDDADGLVYQSLGGGGGNGGFTVSGAVSGAGTGSGAVALGIGGSGGDGGDGGSVSSKATADVVIDTFGDGSKGLVAQSIGGGGGNGGFAVSGAITGAGTGAGAVSVGIGGSGGDGGMGGDVDGVFDGSVFTRGDDADGLVYQSLGGGGGNGGFSVAGVGAGAGTGAGALSVGIGGFGGGGGNSGVVRSKAIANIGTLGEGSTGLLAQSIGGGGGNGGFSVSGAITGAGTGSGAVSLGIGGFAGDGGDADMVDGEFSGRVYTKGDESDGLVYQSLGGGGGNGGFTVSGAITGAGKGSGALALGIGGAGGDGGEGGSVSADAEGIILTLGHGSKGLLAQSIGGGGGNGGFSIAGVVAGAGTGSGAASVGIGGFGGGGGPGGDVTGVFDGLVYTEGDDADGLVYQSLGGGGGNGGFNVSGTLTLGGKGSGGASVGIGGAGGAGGDGGNVVTDTKGYIITDGDGSSGLHAQSIGGGGGNGGFNVSGSIAGSGGKAGVAAAVGIGGFGGDGGKGGNVTGEFDGAVVSYGDQSEGLVYQSLGGGGGNGGFNISGSLSLSKELAGAAAVGIGGFGGGGGKGGDVSASVSGIVATYGEDADAVKAQSVGGGGGQGGVNVSGALSASAQGKSASVAVGVGGFGGDGGNGGTVVLERSGRTRTTGDGSKGLVAQSIGGGGGQGGVNVSGSVALSLKQEAVSASVGLGGFGGGGGNAGEVSVSVDGDVHTGMAETAEGEDAIGILAQSVGGSGGQGGVNVSGALSLAKSGTSAALGIGVGGFGGGGGDASAVSLDMKGNIVTEGAGAHGAFVQSLGGGGGNGGVNVSGGIALADSTNAFSAALGVGGFGGDGGDAGDVHVAIEGSVLADGFASYEYVRVPDAEIDGETIEGSGYSYRRIKDGSHGVFAQSLGGGGGNGALNVSGGIALVRKQGGKTGSLVVGVGGFGGGGGSAGKVDASVTGGGRVISEGDDRSGILAQSIGGGGGNGGVNVSGGIVSDGPIIVGVGGFGGDGGTADDVSVLAVTDIEARGERATGILAQSIGGGGGNGGFNLTGSIEVGKNESLPALTFGIGGFGGSGATSGEVSVVQDGTIRSEGPWGHGIQAQSIAGGGGNGGLNTLVNLDKSSSKKTPGTSTGSKSRTGYSVALGIGGFAGDGADAGDVLVSSTGNITTNGAFARGILAQSIGGGGGTGGANSDSVSTNRGSAFAVGIGGFGGGGGNGGMVQVRRGQAGLPAGLVMTSGMGAIGIEASSIGGGGGDAGASATAVTIVASTQGGSGSGGSDSGNGDTGSGDPENTEGADENPWSGFVGDGVASAFADTTGQSGSGGSGGSIGSKKAKSYALSVSIGGAAGSAGHGGIVDVEHYGNIATDGFQSYGILAQSVGGGGGNAAVASSAVKADSSMAARISLGGAAGEGGDGGEVRVVHHGTIMTKGNDAAGVLAQSVGGGGGNAAVDAGSVTTNAKAIGISIGRQGGTGGVGGDVSLASDGFVSTSGDNAYGLLAQSIGGGGGNSSSYSGGLSLPGKKDDDGFSAAVSVGIEGGVGSKGGNVRVESGGEVQTLGRKAHAVFAQSVGGGGGNGGSGNASGVTASDLLVSIGGAGGSAGTGGAVSVDNIAALRTEGFGAAGIFAQSIGGGGGTGGTDNDGSLTVTGMGALVMVGGSGSEGSTGGRVDVANAGQIVTFGDRANGIVAQSVGGGGGNGGMMTSSLVAQADSSSSAKGFALSVGGSGGEGGGGGVVNVLNNGGVYTFGRESVGILAQSVGGGGGDGSTIIHGMSSSGSESMMLSLAIGGTGGEGGTGGRVMVTNARQSGRIATTGDGAHGILALSIGGGGGTGSTVMTAPDSGAPSDTASVKSLALSIGGKGGTGGKAGSVEVLNDGVIVTEGAGAHGIVAESIGGGGGNGGVTMTGAAGGSIRQSGIEASLAVGGTGGDGNTGGDVHVVNTGGIATYGDGSFGILAQSVGGGGGNGALAVVEPLSITDLPELSLNHLLTVGIGGLGGDGGDGGDVLVDHTGSITTYGDNTYGIFAQSVGGGGGRSALAVSSPLLMGYSLELPAVLGGGDGAVGSGGSVEVKSTGTIVTFGKNSAPVFTQSINGGGGDLQLYLDLSGEALEPAGAASVMAARSLPLSAGSRMVMKQRLGGSSVEGIAGEDVSQTHIGDIVSGRDYSSGVMVQSIGGGGGKMFGRLVLNGDAVLDLDLLLGAAGSDDTAGGGVDFVRDGNVLTEGRLAEGVLLQSVGGGGGSAIVVAERSSGFMKSLADPLFSTVVTLGADGGSGLDGGHVNAAMSGDLYTLGERSAGLFMQSIGAGGGDVAVTGMDAATVMLGGRNGASGNGGNVTITNEGAIGTQGSLSHGVLLQSIGGGGGAVFTDIEPSAIDVVKNVGNSGDGGDVSFTQKGAIRTEGAGAYGVLAQSVGGGGGVVDTLFAGTSGGAGKGGKVALSLDGDVLALGKDAVAVFAQSAGRDGAGDISVDLLGKYVVGGTGSSAGVVIDGGGANSLRNHAVLSTMNGIGGMAIRGGLGGEMVDNFGVVAGNVDLGVGLNRFNNHTGSTLYSGRMLDVGEGNLVFSEGDIAPGGNSAVYGTSLLGDLEQTADGRFLCDLDFDGNVADRIDASGSALLGGEVVLTTLNPQELLPGSHRTIIVTGGDGVEQDGLELVVAPSAVVSYALQQPDAGTLALGFDIDFSPEGLTPNQGAMGDYFNGLQLAGGSEAMDPYVIHLFELPDLQSLADTYEPLIPDEYFSFARSSTELMRMPGQMLSERMRGLQSWCNGSGTIVEDRQGKRHAVWFNASGRWAKEDAAGGFAGFESDSWGVSGGVDIVCSESAVAGIGVGTASADVDMSSGEASGSVSSYYVSIYGGFTNEGWYGNAVLSYGFQQYDVVRTYEGFSVPRRVSGDHDGSAMAFNGEFGYRFDFDGLLLRPFASLSYVSVHEDGFTEKGADELDLIVDDRTTSSLVSSVGLHAGKEFRSGKGSIVPELSVAWMRDFGVDDRELTGSFAGGPISSFTVGGPVTEGNGFGFGASLHYFNGSGLGFGVRYSNVSFESYRSSHLQAELKVGF